MAKPLLHNLVSGQTWPWITGIFKPTGLNGHPLVMNGLLPEKVQSPPPSLPVTLKVCVVLSTPTLLAKSLLISKRFESHHGMRMHGKPECIKSTLKMLGSNADRFDSLSYPAFIFPFQLWLSELSERTMREKGNHWLGIHVPLALPKETPLFQ